MKEWICTKCCKVVNANTFECCGIVEPFEPVKHGAKLVPHSNAWINIYNRWQNNELWKQVAQELANDGCFSAAAVFNEFVERLGGENAA